MTTKLIDHSPALVQAVHDIFHRAKACHCQGDGKLSENEVLEQLVLHRYVTYEAANEPKFLPIEEACRDVQHFPPWRFGSERGVEYLPDLQSWTFADLCRIQGVGPVTATHVECVMARYGLALKDGDPARYAHLDETEPEPEGRQIEGTPDEIRRTCAKDLVDIGKRLLTHGASLMRYSIRTAARERVGGQLKRHAKAVLRAHGEAISIGNVLQALEAREAPQKPVAKRGRRARRVEGEIVQTGNVVSGAFPQAAAGE